MDTLDADLRAVLAPHEDVFSLTESGKIQCKINGHTLPARLDVLQAFVRGPKFQTLLRRQTAEDSLSKYEPFIVQSANFPLMLYCALTGQLMDKSLSAVRMHMQGKRFQRAKDRFTRDEIELRPEPSLEQFGVRLPRSSKDGDDHSARRLQEPAGATNGSGGGSSSSGTSMSGDSDASSMRSSGSSSSGTDDENCVWAAAVASDEECEAAVADGGGKDGSNGGTISGRRSGGTGAGGTGNGAAATAQPIGNQLQQHKGKKKQELKHKQQLKMKEKMGPGSKVVARQQRGSAPQSKRAASNTLRPGKPKKARQQ